METLLFISYLILIFSTIYSLISLIKLLLKNKFSGYIIFISVLIMFYIIPVYWDLITEIPFDIYEPIYRAWKDVPTTIFYNIYISVVLLFFTFNMLSVKHKKLHTHLLQIGFINFLKKFKILFIIILILPYISILLSDNFSFYLVYRSTLGFKESLIYPNMHPISTKLSLLAIICMSFVITVMLLNQKLKIKRYNIINWALIISMTISYCWIDGKRAIVAVFLVVCFTLFLLVNIINKKNIARSTITFSILFVLFNIGYGKNIHEDNVVKSQKDARLEFSRDYGVRFNIYSELFNDKKILPNKLDTYKFNIAFYIPREYWNDKPQPYAVYFTNAAFGNFGQGQLYGWGLTTNAFSEGISNLGWFGLIIVPFFLNIILKKETKSTKPLFKLVSTLICILSLVLQPMPFMPIIILYFILLLFNQTPKKETI